MKKRSLNFGRSLFWSLAFSVAGLALVALTLLNSRNSLTAPLTSPLAGSYQASLKMSDHDDQNKPLEACPEPSPQCSALPLPKYESSVLVIDLPKTGNQYNQFRIQGRLNYNEKDTGQNSTF